MAIARMSGGPLDGQVIPVDDVSEETIIVPFSEGQLVYRRTGEPINTGEHDGPTEAPFTFVESTENIVPSDGDDARDDSR